MDLGRISLLDASICLFRLSFCRLEKQSAAASGKNLSLFDPKLSAALAALRQHGFADRLLASGGSPAFMLGKTSSKQVINS